MLLESLRSIKTLITLDLSLKLLRLENIHFVHIARSCSELYFMVWLNTICKDDLNKLRRKSLQFWTTNWNDNPSYLIFVCFGILAICTFFGQSILSSHRGRLIPGARQAWIRLSFPLSIHNWQGHKARRCDSITPETITHWPTDRGNC